MTKIDVAEWFKNDEKTKASNVVSRLTPEDFDRFMGEFLENAPHYSRHVVNLLTRARTLDPVIEVHPRDMRVNKRYLAFLRFVGNLAELTNRPSRSPVFDVGMDGEFDDEIADRLGRHDYDADKHG